MPLATIRGGQWTRRVTGQEQHLANLTTSCSTLGYAMAGATIAAAHAAEGWVGRGDEQGAELAAATAMREALNAIAFAGRVVVGEVDIPVLNVGEDVGSGKGLELDIALEALEGTTLTRRRCRMRWR